MKCMLFDEVKKSIENFSFEKLFFSDLDESNVDITGVIVITDNQIVNTISFEGNEHFDQIASIYKIIYGSEYEKLKKVMDDEEDTIMYLDKNTITFRLYNTCGTKRMIIWLPNSYISYDQYKLLNLFFKKNGSIIDEVCSEYARTKNEKIIIFADPNSYEKGGKVDSYQEVLEYAKNIIRYDVERDYSDDNIIGDTAEDLKKGIKY